jgi:RNA polymerase sigma-70 factor (ECF subfamily)
MEGLLALLSRDVVLHSDGGGKAAAVPKPIKGAQRVANGIMRSLEKNVPKDVVGHIADINGERGVIGYLNGKPFSVLTLDVHEGRIQGVYVVTNPDKLSRLPDLRTNHQSPITFHLSPFTGSTFGVTEVPLTRSTVEI